MTAFSKQAVGVGHQGQLHQPPTYLPGLPLLWDVCVEFEYLNAIKECIIYPHWRTAVISQVKVNMCGCQEKILSMVLLTCYKKALLESSSVPLALAS